ncbi:MAG: formyl transferase [Armatimonadetes bacterium]|nr:formyl transferase [Armatimonadota bacterium]MDW8121234.1 formyltransferase family protein [Armatimonadota bacterium]
MTYKIGWFSTGRDLEALNLLAETLRSIRLGFLPVDIRFVFVSREEGDSVESDQFLGFCRQEGLKVITLSAKRFEPELRRKGRSGDPEALNLWRRLYHQEVERRLKPYWLGVSVSLLAGYMLIVSDEFCSRYPLINLHPALPGGPAGSWQQVIRCLIREKAYEAGAQIHRVTPQLDSGPPLTYCRVPIRTPDLEPLWQRASASYWSEELPEPPEPVRPLFEAIRQKEFAREKPLILLTLKKLAEKVLELTDNGVRYQGRPCPGGLDITEEVEKALRKGVIGGSC